MSETKKGLEHHTKYRIPVYTGQGPNELQKAKILPFYSRE
jgi:hypothetical protein